MPEEDRLNKFIERIIKPEIIIRVHDYLADNEVLVSRKMYECINKHKAINEHKAINDLAWQFYRMHGYVAPEAYDFSESIHPQEQLMWQMAECAYEFDWKDYEETSEW